jgi:hypothetical protein
MGGHNVKAPINSGGQLGGKKMDNARIFSHNSIHAFILGSSVCMFANSTYATDQCVLYVINCSM